VVVADLLVVLPDFVVVVALVELEDPPVVTVTVDSAPVARVVVTLGAFELKAPAARATIRASTITKTTTAGISRLRRRFIISACALRRSLDSW
jgi:hypothetical protein